MSEYGVMTPAGHASFTTTHRFYLAVADGLLDRVQAATAQGMCKKWDVWEHRTFLKKKQLTTKLGSR